MYLHVLYALEETNWQFSQEILLPRSNMDWYHQAGADYNKATTTYGATPLHWATLHGHVDAVRLLLAANADLAPRKHCIIRQSINK